MSEDKGINAIMNCDEYHIPINHKDPNTLCEKLEKKHLLNSRRMGMLPQISRRNIWLYKWFQRASMWFIC